MDQFGTQPVGFRFGYQPVKPIQLPVGGIHTRFIGTGYNKDIRMLSDFGSELYYIRPLEEA